MLNLNLRTRVQPFKGVDEWREVALRQEIPAAETALLICDMWDHHWCRSAERRAVEIAKKMDGVVAAARRKGVLVIHAPSDTMEFYQDAPQRRAMQAIPQVEPPAPREIYDPGLPVDSSDGGCDDEPPCPVHYPWKRQMEILHVADGDLISDRGTEVYSALRHHVRRLLVIMGVHTNMCVLNRTFAIRQMTRWGVPVALVRDLTDTMYNPRMSPFVAHEEGTELVVQHIEKYWCPTIVSEDLAR
jgi:nicotinamidase-related amidase